MAHHPHVRKTVGYHLSWLTIRSTQTWWKSSRKTGIFCIIRQLAKNYSQINQCWLIAGTEICETTLYVPTCWNPFKQKKNWCQELNVTTSITCTTTGRTYRGPENINCRVNNVVYILTCNQCKKQYIGETGRPFIERWKEHLYDIKVKRPYPVARHFNENDDHKKATFHAKILSLINGTA